MNAKSISLGLILFYTLTLLGCAQPKIVINDDISAGSMGNNATIVIEDTRPTTDKEFTVGSFMVFNDDYGIWTLGDEMFVPTTLELLKKHINHATSKWTTQPKEIKLELKRLKFESNHQAELLLEGSAQLGPLGVAIAESMHGKKFETDFDKTKPFVLGFIEADVTMTFANGKTKKKSLSAYKAVNFRSHMDVEGRMEAASKTVKALYSTFTKSL